jgi:hypothetical protein
MTIEELTFKAFQQGLEQGREERAEEIERLRAHIKITQTRLIILRMQVNSGYDFNENLASIDVLLNDTRAALQPKEGEYSDD